MNYSPNALNQYDTIDSIAQDHDANGNLISDGLNTYSFDAENRLASGLFDDGAGGTIAASYTYDPFMRRISKTVDGTTTYFLWSRDLLVGERDGAGTRTRRYVYLGDYAPALVEDPDGSGSNDRYRVHFDHLDTPRHLTDASGTVVWQAEIEAFGRAVVDENPVAFHLRFPGQYEDAESGLHYNRFRYYDPSIGRYISADAIGIATWQASVEAEQGDGLNLYLYVRNSPLLLVDPPGLDPFGGGFEGSDPHQELSFIEDSVLHGTPDQGFANRRQDCMRDCLVAAVAGEGASQAGASAAARVLSTLRRGAAFAARIIKNVSLLGTAATLEQHRHCRRDCSDKFPEICTV